MFTVDTNILVYAADQSAPDHERYRHLLIDWRTQSTTWFLTWKVMYEFLRVVTHPKVLNQPYDIADAWHYLRVLLDSPALQILSETDRHGDVAAEVIEQNPWLRANLVHDAHTAILMKEHGIRRIYTRDADFRRFDFIEPIDPLR